MAKVLLKLVDLANRRDFRLGPLLVSPARRVVEGPAGSANVQPVVMKILLVLLDARGDVVTREDLFATAWGGVFVGDDSLNQAITRIRKVAAKTAPGLLDIETVPRTGYRLTGRLVSMPPSEDSRFGPSRRLFIGAAMSTAAVGVLCAVSWVRLSSNKSDLDQLLEDTELQLSALSTFDPPQTVKRLESATVAHPENAKAWGLLALAHSIISISGISGSAQSAAKAQSAAARAMAIDPQEPNGQLALYELQGATLDWFSRDQRLRRIIDHDGRNVFAISELVGLLQSVGLTRESWYWNEKAIGLRPAVPDLLCRRAMKLWITERYSAADTVIDHARDLWPSNPFVLWVRFLLLATTGRPSAAERLLSLNSNMLPAPALPLWSTALQALNHRTVASLEGAKKACSEAAQMSSMLAAQAVMIAGALGQKDLAFEVCRGLLLWRGPLTNAGANHGSALGSDAQWRSQIQWLFTPPCRSLRGDVRFLTLCRDLGLHDYWKRRGLQPDFLREA